MRLEQDILESTTENAKLLTKQQQERQKLLTDIEKVAKIMKLGTNQISQAQSLKPEC